MGSIPDEKVQEVRDRVDIVDLVGRYVDLRRSGQNYKGLCPFHSERTPSFNVNPARKGYKCFGCGESGDAIGFVMQLEGKSFPEAIRKLAELYGVTLPATGHRSASADELNERDQAYTMMRRAAELYREILLGDDAGAAGREYVAHRELSDEVSESFGLGYAPAPAEAGWDRLVQSLKKEGMSVDLAIRLGLAAQSERRRSAYDRFRGRLMFPVHQPGGEVVGFSGRIVPPHDDEDGENPPPKYINSPDTLLARKGKLLFGLAQARRALSAKRRAILVEGNIDVVKLHQWELQETVAPMGTALTDDQAKLLARFTDQVVMCFDGDQAGKKAAWTSLPILLSHDLDVRMVLLPPGEDPDSLGRDRLLALLERARPALVEMMIRIAAKAGTAVDARAQGLDRVIPLIAKVPRESARDLYADRAAELFNVPRARVATAVGHAVRAVESGRRGAAPASRPPRSSGGPPPGHPAAFGDSGEFRAERGSSMPVSAPVQPSPQLPGGQAQLTMLLVDVPHLAAAARREGALDCVTDSRLAPIARAVVDGASTGHDPTLDELLSLVDERDQRLVHDAVFQGNYRAESIEDPAAILRELVHRCRVEVISGEISGLNREFRSAAAAGEIDRARDIQLRMHALRRERDALLSNPGAPPPPASVAAEPVVDPSAEPPHDSAPT